jgi:SAM-dependent methyltransferase
LVDCNICGWSGNEFQPLRSPGYAHEDQNVFCPNCGSYERHRALASYVDKAGILPASGLSLELGNGMIRACKLLCESQGLTHVSLDMWPGFGDVVGDLAALPFRACSFDVLICIHVLEHVADDFRALSEIHRIAKPDSLLILQVPFDDRRFDTVEYEPAADKRLHAGYNYGHIREYGLDILERLGFFWKAVSEIHPLLLVTESEARRHGFEKNYGTTFFCSNSAKNRQYPAAIGRDLTDMKRHWMVQRRAYEMHLADRVSDPFVNWINAERELRVLSDEAIRKHNVFEILRPGIHQTNSCHRMDEQDDNHC